MLINKYFSCFRNLSCHYVEKFVNWEARVCIAEAHGVWGIPLSFGSIAILSSLTNLSVVIDDLFQVENFRRNDFVKIQGGTLSQGGGSWTAPPLKPPMQETMKGTVLNRTLPSYYTLDHLRYSLEPRVRANPSFPL